MPVQTTRCEHALVRNPLRWRTVMRSAVQSDAGRQDSPPQFVRLANGRVVAGVTTGLAEHLGIDVIALRLAFVLLALANGAGCVLYAAFWALAPQRRDSGELVEERTSVRSELAHLVALATFIAGGLLTAHALGLGLRGPIVWPLTVTGFGVLVVWRQVDDVARARFRAATSASRGLGLLRAGLGVVFVVGGGAVLLAAPSLSATRRALFATLIVVLGLALVSGPYWLRMARELAAERAARIREQERADIAAHVHDSVLHTLTLIQRNVGDPREVARLARAQERELRTWLYRPAPAAAESFAAALEEVIGEVEDNHGMAVEVVVVGEASVDDGVRTMVAATREAAVNAVKHGKGVPVSVYAEVQADVIEVYVRDRGPGFVLADVADDRMGIKGSIMGRMQRHGG